MAAEAEHVRPGAQLQLRQVRLAAQLPAGFDQAADMLGHLERVDLSGGAQLGVEGVAEFVLLLVAYLAT